MNFSICNFWLSTSDLNFFSCVSYSVNFLLDADNLSSISFIYFWISSYVLSKSIVTFSTADIIGTSGC